MHGFLISIYNFPDEILSDQIIIIIDIFKFSEKLNYPFLQIFLRVMVSLLCRLQAVSKIQVSIYSYLISKERRHCHRHSNETVTIRKHVAKYKNMWQWRFEFFRTFENRGINIDRVHSIHKICQSIKIYHKIYQFTVILYGVEGPLWCWHFKTNHQCL